LDAQIIDKLELDKVNEILDLINQSQTVSDLSVINLLNYNEDKVIAEKSKDKVRIK
jgi:hypothetical protein